MRTTLVVLAVLASSLAGLLAASTPAVAGELVVGVAPGRWDAARASIGDAGGRVVEWNGALSFAVVATADVERTTAALARDDAVRYVEPNGDVAAAGVSWDGVDWNGVDWNGVEWNGVDWNGVDWNGQQGGDVQDPGRGWQSPLARVKAPQAWDTTSGTLGATLCVIDSGVAWDHPDLEPNMWTAADGSHGFNAIDGTTDAYDDAGHGTHVAGVAAARIANEYGIAGVANVRIMAVKVLDATGHGEDADLADGIQWCADRGADVALMALGGADASAVVTDAIGYAVERDVLLVASAGNTGGEVHFPARDERVIAVSATDGSGNGVLASWSSRGAEIDISAPGVSIIGPRSTGGFMFVSGTSQAAAFVAGAAALVRDHRPDLQSDPVRSALESGAKDFGAPGWDSEFGHGRLRVREAVDGVSA